MSTFDRTMTFDAPADAVRLVFPFALYPAHVVERPEQARALARIDDFLHVFEWTVSGGRTTLRYRICHDMRGVLDDLADNPAVYESAPADLTELETLQAEATLNRLRAAVADIHPATVKPSIPSPAPFSMDMLFLWTLLLSAGGVFMAAMNWRRLGRPDRFWPTLVAGTALYVGGAFALVRALERAPFAPALALIPFAALVGALLARWQHGAYQHWVESYGPPTAAAQRFGADTIVVLVVASALVALPFLTLTGQVTRLWGGGRITASGVSLSFPAGWSASENGADAGINCEDEFLNECVLVLSRADQAGILMIQRQRQLVPSNDLVMTSAVAMTGLRLMLGSTGIQFDSPVAVRVDDRPAFRQSGAAPSSSIRFDMLIVQESPYSTVIVYAFALQDERGGVKREIDDMVASLRFEES